MSGVLTFTMTFHGPFTVATGAPGRGLDMTIDPDVPIPASSMKGLMRGRAEHTLGIHSKHIAHIFGSATIACPWAWTDPNILELAPRDNSRTRQSTMHARVAVNDDGSAVQGALKFGEHYWAESATFTVESISKPMGSPGDHELVLRAAARAVTSFGGGRRRGSGWVTIKDNHDWTHANSIRLLELQQEPTS